MGDGEGKGVGVTAPGGVGGGGYSGMVGDRMWVLTCCLGREDGDNGTYEVGLMGGLLLLRWLLLLVVLDCWGMGAKRRGSPSRRGWVRLVGDGRCGCVDVVIEMEPRREMWTCGCVVVCIGGSRRMCARRRREKLRKIDEAKTDTHLTLRNLNNMTTL